MPGDFNFKNLVPGVRLHILAEIDLDIEGDVLSKSKRFNDTGSSQYPSLIRAAAQSHNEAWLAEQLQKIGAFNDKELRGGKPVDVPKNAHTLFAQCEFNRFYIRGLCRYAIEHSIPALRVYRARESSNPRPDSEAKIGMVLTPSVLLQDLRERIATDLEFGLPEINSGLSVELAQENAGS